MYIEERLCHVLCMRNGGLYFGQSCGKDVTRKFKTQEEALSKLAGIVYGDLCDACFNIVKYRKRPDRMCKGFMEYGALMINYNNREIWIEAKVTTKWDKLVYVPRLPIMVCYVK